jgi:hypothetical protein
VDGIKFIVQTPALHIDRKTTHGPCDEARAFTLALQAAKGNEYSMPIKFGRKNLGYIGGIIGTDLVWHIPANQMPLDAAGFPTLANLQAQRAAGFTYSQVWYRLSSGFQTNAWIDLWSTSGASDPPVGTYTGTAFTARQFTDTTAGAIRHGGNISPLQKHLSYFCFEDLDSAANSLVYVLYDRVLTYELCTFTAAVSQNMTNTLTAQRYVSAGQPGMQIVATCQAATGATASNLTALSYTNHAGTSGSSIQNGSTLTFQISISTSGAGGSVANAAVHCPTFAGTNGLFLPLAPGDLGARSIQSYTTSAANTGSTCFVLAYPLAYIVTPAAQVLCEKDMLHNHMLPSRIYDGACLSSFIYCGQTSNGGTVTGRIETVWG